MNTNKGVLKEVYPNTKNNSPMIPLDGTNAQYLIDSHTKNGFAFVSACKGFADSGLDGNNPEDREALSAINSERTRELITLVQNKGFSYTLLYGGFIEEPGTVPERKVYERGVIIYAEKRNGEVDSRGMFELASEICKRYNQDSVLVKMPNENPKYISQDGSAGAEFSGVISFNGLAQTYFTDLHKNTVNKTSGDSRATRFSFTESYIAPKPLCYSESHVRYLKGEVFLKR